MRPDYGSDNPNQTWLNLARSGVVYERRNGRSGPEVKVYYGDRNLVTDWLPVNQSGSAGAAFHVCPRVGDNVTVLHLGTGMEQGIVLGSHGTDNNPVFTPNSVDSVAMATEDGAYFEHEPQSSTFTMAGVGTLHLSVGGQSLIFTGTFTLNVGGAVTIDAGSATIKAGSITLDGPVHITQSLTVDGSITGKANEHIDGDSYSGSRSGGPI
jgi:phage baseplate assembly protein V